MSTWSLQKLLHALAGDVGTQLTRSRELLAHPVAKGDASEWVWLHLLQQYLPKRYDVRRAYVVDSNGQFSDQIDIVIHDCQYSPFVFRYGGAEVVPAESVYAAFEVKQSLNATHIAYTHEKLATVRRLHRTSKPVPWLRGLSEPKSLHSIIGGILTLSSEWSPPLGDALKAALATSGEGQQIDLLCVADAGMVERAADGTLDVELAKGAGARFLLALIARLQELGTAPMLDVRAYAEWLK